jgi:hypothetical protein
MRDQRNVSRPASERTRAAPASHASTLRLTDLDWLIAVAEGVGTAAAVDDPADVRRAADVATALVVGPAVPIITRSALRIPPQHSAIGYGTVQMTSHRIIALQ